MQDVGTDYILGHSEGETRRLILQAQIYRPTTRRMLRTAGIGPGMSVLDIGSGAGDVAFLLADLVGPQGRVLGVDANSEILALARTRAAAAGLRNVEFRQARLEAFDLAPGFDAVVGRWVLMYLHDPVSFLGRLSRLLRPGGIVAFNEMDLVVPPRTFPAAPVHTEIERWMVPPENAPGPDVRIGTKLYRLFIEAGLPRPEMLLEAPVGGGPDWPGYAYLAETLRSLLPALARNPGFDATSIDVGTLAERLQAEVTELDGIQLLPALVGAWTRRQ